MFNDHFGPDQKKNLPLLGFEPRTPPYMNKELTNYATETSEDLFLFFNVTFTEKYYTYFSTYFSNQREFNPNNLKIKIKKREH